MVVFFCNSSNPLERTFWFFFVSVLFFLPFLSLLLSFKASSIASPFQTQVSCIWGLLVSLLFVSWLLLCFLFLFFLVDLPFFCLCLLFCFEIRTTNAVFPAILGFFFQKGCYYRWYRQRVSGNSRDVLLVFPAPKALFQNHSRFVIFSCFFFCLPFQHCFFSSTPFEILFLERFFGFIFVAPFLSSFLLRSFQPVSCHPLLQSTLLSC